MTYIIKRFEELTTNELYEILKIRAEVFVVEQKCAYQDVDDEDKISYHLIGTDKGRVGGYLRIIDKDSSNSEVWIGRVLTTKEYRGKGVAKELMKEAKNFIENNLKKEFIRLAAQGYLIKFYENLEFKVVGEMYLEDDIPHIDMQYSRNS